MQLPPFMASTDGGIEDHHDIGSLGGARETREWPTRDRYALGYSNEREHARPHLRLKR